MTAAASSPTTPTRPPALGIAYTLEKVTDLARIADFNVLITPALVIDGNVRSAGKLLTVEEIKAMLKPKILFLCTGNSCRSQMAEGFARSLRMEFLDAWSAGVQPHGLDPRSARHGRGRRGYRHAAVEERQRACRRRL